MFIFLWSDSPHLIELHAPRASPLHHAGRWLMRYATSQKIAGSSPDEVIEFLQFT
jgi:hypothetical protein